MDILSALRKVTASIKTWADSKLETKLDKNLGTDNVGKVLTIGDDGNIKSQMLDTGIIVLSGTNDNPINIDEIKVSGTYLIKGVVTTSMDTTSGSDSAKLNKTFIDGFARGELMSIYSLQDGFVNQLMMNPTRSLVRLDSGEGYSDAIDASYVQPVEKTTEMTQPVGIRSDGQLFTEPFNQVQSDWNQYNKKQPDYVKNRTHYTRTAHDSGYLADLMDSTHNIGDIVLLRGIPIPILDKLFIPGINASYRSEYAFHIMYKVTFLDGTDVYEYENDKECIANEEMEISEFSKSNIKVLYHNKREPSIALYIIYDLKTLNDEDKTKFAKTGIYAQLVSLNAADTATSILVGYRSIKYEKLDSKYIDIPVATNDVAGVVKPVAKTDEMSQDVGVDADGRLYTLPIALPMTGATADTDGAAGLVPAPKAGQHGKFLRGDGTWADVPAGDGTGTVNSATSISFPPIMQTAPLGQLFEAPMNYTAWCPGNLRYDKNLDKYVDLLYCNDVHVNPTQKGMFIVYIDPVTFEANVPVAAKYVDDDGVTEIIPTGADGIGATNFNILTDGRYCIIKDNGDGKSMYRFISSDNGVTWVKSEAASVIPSTLYGCTVLSNGRWIGCDDTLNCYFYYSDDEGITWTAVKPETGGFYYEGEACILELKPNVLMAVGRMTLSGMGYSESGDAEHALLSFSYDNGESWSKWEKSETIDNMNASSCTGFVHDGIVEIFTASRWFHRSNNAVTDYTNTGKSGAITHYVATVDNALNDKFTNRGIVVYANGMAGSASDLPAQDFHAPCLATNGIGTDFLLVYFDRFVEPYTTESANHHFVHGSLYGFVLEEDVDGRTGRTYSTKKIESLISSAVKKLNIRIDEFIASGGKGETSEYFYVTDGLVYHIDAVSDDAISNRVLADKIGGTECALTATSGYEVEFSNYGLIHAAISCTGAKGFLDNPQEFTIECCTYNRTNVESYLGKIPYGTGSAYNDFGRNGRTSYAYLNSAGEAKTGNFSEVTFASASNQLNHLLFVHSADGIKGYLNGIFMGELSKADLGDFASWNNYFSEQNQRVISIYGSDTHYFRSFRVYGKALTAEEAAQNYKYEKYRLENV